MRFRSPEMRGTILTILSDLSSPYIGWHLAIVITQMGDDYEWRFFIRVLSGVRHSI